MPWNQIEPSHDRLPDFDQNGNLPPGDYAPETEEFEQRFVSIEESSKRRQIYEGWNRHRSDLMNRGLRPKARILVDGSYVTEKRDAGDIDVAVEVHVSDPEKLSGKDHKLCELLQGKTTRSTYQCDAYPVFVLPETHVQYKIVTQKAYEYWLKWFGKDRNGKEKGRVWAFGEGLR